ncbi:MAG: M20/M25/M40 family metallo-hydrolase [Patescibacteria group bacterium]|nr:M20/M25/M40 family metallo-hydrolase [Patescibacteria group bacterium]
MKDIVNLFIKLIQINSVSGEEEKIREFIINLIKNKKNFTYQIDKIGNLFVKTKGKGKPILFCAHLDTVEPGRGIKPQIKNGFLTSSGKTILGADNKVFVALLVDLLINHQINRNLEIIFSVKEETGGGIEFFPFNWLKAKTGIIFDNANPVGGIVLRSPEIINFYIEFLGKSTHASTPDKGINSLLPTIEFLKKIKIGYSNKKNTTVNIGLLNSGTAINSIPENTIIKGEIRSYDNKNFIYLKNKFKKTINLIQKKFKGNINIKFDGYCPGYQHKKNDKFLKKIFKIIKENKIKPYFLNKSGISDANILNFRKIKTVVLSDGVIEPHTTRERININDFLILKKIFFDLVNFL